jgi:hypothetical protein
MRHILFSFLAMTIMASCTKEDIANTVVTPPVTPPPVTNTSTSYYVSALGNDANDGRTPETPWKTLNRVNQVNLKPGESLLLRSGDVFQGTLDLSYENGSVSAPIIVGSYGSSRAIIDAGATGSGIIAKNPQYIIVRDLIVRGAGYKINPSNGVFFYTDSTVKMKNISFQNIDVSGFMGRGLYVQVPYPEYKTNQGGQRMAAGERNAGFENVAIEYVDAHDNGMAGIETDGYWTANSNNQWHTLINHKNVSVRYSTAYNNHGVSTYTHNHSGSGIMVAAVEDAIIEFCEAYNNGSENGKLMGGPIGIWMTEVRNGVIQHSEAHHNHGGVGPDGGGFDIDGGSVNCIIQYCYSHENDGAGLAVYEWGSGNPMSNITIRHNISENDGLKKNYGGITLWSVQPIDNINIYNNTVYVNSAEVVESTPMNTITVMDEQYFTNMRVFNNVFLASGANARILGGSIRTGNWLNNMYWTTDGAVSNGFTYGLQSDPKLVGPGKEGFTDPNTRLNVSTNVLGYTPLAGSPLINAGITLGLNLATTDLKGSALPSGGSYDIGALEYQ